MATMLTVCLARLTKWMDNTTDALLLFHELFCKLTGAKRDSISTNEWKD